MDDAREWERTANTVRPFRHEVFAHFVTEVRNHSGIVSRVLELGSGPGFLAQRLLQELDNISYVALDFSDAMHELARARLGPLAERVEFVTADFKDPIWTEGLGSFDCIVTLQAVHELRHKRYATTLHRQARSVLAPNGLYLFCDHFVGEGGMENAELYMSLKEQQASLVAAGFAVVERCLQVGSVSMHRATN
jgi:SAM-dependent methyltransferase